MLKRDDGWYVVPTQELIHFNDIKVHQSLDPRALLLATLLLAGCMAHIEGRIGPPPPPAPPTVNTEVTVDAGQRPRVN